ncbi:pin1 [Candida margitis]|uniref:pin1 n=1 Tax=Candida margitis TaxID=1775924 RepID=UPI0022267C6D|nr:pin1 [Candida margitis]KAI5969502.1 pin1 [Candida margitis]
MSSLATGLPPNWTIKVSKTHDKEYYLNQSTNESSWDPPYGTDLSVLNEYLTKFKENGRKPVINKDGKIRASHILTKHQKSRNPKSWRNPDITISREEAIDRERDILAKLLKGDSTFSEIATSESDCSSHGRGGDLGYFGKKEMQPAFENAAFGLHVGEISNLIETDSGIHIIQRTG